MQQVKILLVMLMMQLSFAETAQMIGGTGAIQIVRYAFSTILLLFHQTEVKEKNEDVFKGEKEN